MAKKIQIDIEVNGKMQKATVSTKKLKQALDGAKQSQDQLNTSTRTGYRAFQGTAQNTANSTKAFAKQAGVVGGLVPIYASIAANVFAISAAFGVLSRNAAVQQLETSLTNTGIAAGKNLPFVAQGLRDITGAAISTEAALRATAIATTSGFSTSQLQGLTKVATGASIALGRNLPDALDRLVRGTAKLEPEILDELGIIVRLDQATREYAAELKKTAGDLTQFERQQAFLNATITQGLSKYQKIAQTVDPNPYDRLASAFEDLTKTAIEFLNKGLGPIAEFLAQNDFALIGVLGLFSKTILNQVIPTISDFSAASSATFARAARDAKISAARITNEYTVAAKKIQVLDFMPKTYKNLAVSLKAGTASTKDYQKALTSLKISQGRRTAEIKKATLAQKELSGFQLKASQQFLKTKTAELAAIEAQIAATQNLAVITARGATTTVVGGGSVGKAQKKANTDKRRAIGARVERRTLDKIENSSTLGSIGAAAGGLSLLMQNIGRTEGALPKLSESFRSLGSAGKFVTAVFSRMLGPLSLLFIGYSILSSIFPNLLSFTNKQEKELNKLAEAFDKTTAIVVTFNKEMQQTENAVSRSARKLEVMAGITETTAGTFATMQSNAEKVQLKALTQEFDKQLAAQNKLTAAQEEYNRTLNDMRVGRGIVKMRKQDLEDARKAFNKTNADVDKLIDNFGKVSKTQALALLKTNIAQLRGSKAFDTFPELEKQYKDLFDTIQNSDSEFIDLDPIVKQAEKLSEPWREFSSAITSAQEALRRFDTESAKLARVDQTPFSAAIRASKDFEKESNVAINKIGSSIRKDSGQFSLLRDDELVKIEDLEAEMTGVTAEARRLERILKITIKTGGDFKDALSQNNEELSKSQERLIDAKSILKEQEDILKRINRLQSTGSGFVLAQIAQEKQVKKEKIETLEQTKKLNERIIQDEEALRLTNLAVDRQIQAIEADMTNEALEQYRIDQDNVKIKQESLGIMQRELNVQKEINDIARRTDELALTKANRERSRNRFSGSADERAALEERIAMEEADLARKTAFIQAETNMKKANVALEFMLLDAKYKFLAAEASQLATELRASTKDKDGNVIDPDDPAFELAKSLEDSVTRYGDLRGKLGLDELKVTIGEDGSIGFENLKKGGLLSQIFGSIDAGTTLSLAELQDRIVGLKTELLDVDPISKALDGVADQLQDGLGGALGDVIDGTKKAKDAFGDLALSIIKSFRDMMVDEAVNMVFNMMRDNAKENPDGFFGKISSFFNKKSVEDPSTTTTTPTPPVTTTPTAVTQASTVTPTIGGAMTGGVDGMGLGASIGNPLFVTIVENPMAAMAGAAPVAAGAGAGPATGALPSGESTGESETAKATKENTEATNKLNLNTASMVTGTLATVAALTGNEKVAQKLAMVTAALQAIQGLKFLYDKFFAPKKLTSEALNTVALKANTAALLTSSVVPARTGGILSNGKKMAGYSAGGIAKGSHSGYPALLHGTEAVVPLPNGKSIPVEMSGGGGMQQNNVSVNVVMNSDGTSSQDSQQDGRQAAQLGKNISMAVQEEIRKQKRNGGMLSPYGSA